MHKVSTVMTTWHFSKCGSGFSLGCTVHTRSAVNVGCAGARTAINTTEISIKCRDCQKAHGRQFGTLLT